MPEKLTLSLNLNDWGTLNALAKKNGFPGSFEYINAAIVDLAKSHKIETICTGDRRKRKHSYHIPEDCQDFYKNLACLHSTNVSTVIFRYVILPQLITRQQIKAARAKWWLILPPLD